VPWPGPHLDPAARAEDSHTTRAPVGLSTCRYGHASSVSSPRPGAVCGPVNDVSLPGCKRPRCVVVPGSCEISAGPRRCQAAWPQGQRSQRPFRGGRATRSRTWRRAGAGSDPPRLISTRCRDDSSQPTGQPGRRQCPELDGDDDHVPYLPLPRLPAAVRVPSGTEKAPARGSPARAPVGPDSPGRCPSRHAPRAGLCDGMPPAAPPAAGSRPADLGPDSELLPAGRLVPPARTENSRRDGGT
jgi:hypothetical protein